jgi:hypothetical protein
MAFLTLEGTAYEIQVAGANELEPVFVGEVTRAASNASRSTRRTKKRQWSFTLIPMVQADADAFLAVIDAPGTLTASGDFTAGASVEVFALQGTSAFLQNGVSHLRVVTVTLQEA